MKHHPFSVVAFKDMRSRLIMVRLRTVATDLTNTTSSRKTGVGMSVKDKLRHDITAKVATMAKS